MLSFNFIEILANKVDSLTKEKNEPIKIINRIEKFFDGVNLSRIQLEFENIGEKGLKMIKRLFNKTYTDVFKKHQDEIKNDNKSKLIKLLYFFNKHKLFE